MFDNTTRRAKKQRRRVNNMRRNEVHYTPAWEDLRFPATAVNPPGQVSDPDWDNTNGGWLFAASGTEQLWVIAQMPHAWKQGDAIIPHVHWEPTNTNTGDVLWRIQYEWTNIDAVEAGSFTTHDMLDTAAGTAYTHQLADNGTVSATGKTISSIITIKLQRVGSDASDTYNADALLKEFDIHYRANAFGSRQELVK